MANSDGAGFKPPTFHFLDWPTTIWATVALHCLTTLVFAVMHQCRCPHCFCVFVCLFVYSTCRRGFIMGVWNSHTSVGNILGSLIAGVFVSSAWGMSFIVPGIIIASCGILCFFFLVESQFLRCGYKPNHWNTVAIWKVIKSVCICLSVLVSWLCE